MKIYEIKVPDRIHSKFPKEIKHIIENYGFLAGGAIRSILMKEEICDWDIFFEHLSGKDEALNYLVENFNYKIVFQCPIGELTTLKNEDGNKIQLITKFFKTPQDTISQFDLSPSCFAVKKDTLYVLKQALKDYKKKKMSIIHLSFPVATLNRIVKYSKKGYSTHNVSTQFVEGIIGIIESKLSEINIKDIYVNDQDGNLQKVSLLDFLNSSINGQVYID
jgi:hypothetical protein